MNTQLAKLKEQTAAAARKAAPYVWPVTRFTLIWTAIVYAWSFAIAFMWPVQYCVLVPLQFVWRLFKGVGLIAALAFIPFVGWLILAFLLYGKAKNGTPILGEKNYSIRPLLLDQLLAIGR